MYRGAACMAVRWAVAGRERHHSEKRRWIQLVIVLLDHYKFLTVGDITPTARTWAMLPDQNALVKFMGAICFAIRSRRYLC